MGARRNDQSLVTLDTPSHPDVFGSRVDEKLLGLDTAIGGCLFELRPFELICLINQRSLYLIVLKAEDSKFGIPADLESSQTAACSQGGRKDGSQINAKQSRSSSGDFVLLA